MGVPTLLVARTDADSAKLLTSDVDERDHAVPHRRAHRRRLLPHQGRARARPSRAASPTRRTPTWSGARPRTPDLDAGASSSPRRSTRSSRASCSPTTARRRSTGRRTSTTRRSPSSSASWARWATSSSSSRSPASTRSTTRCSSWRAATATTAWRRTRELQQAEFAAEKDGYTATRHQREVGTGYFDEVAQVIAGGAASTLALQRVDRGRAVLRAPPPRAAKVA